MNKYYYALLLDNLYPTEQNKSLLDFLNIQPYNIVIFLLSKENVMPSILPIFSIADYFNFDGITIIIDKFTYEKSQKYPARGPRISIGEKYEGCLFSQSLDFQKIEEIIDGYTKNVSLSN